MNDKALRALADVKRETKRMLERIADLEADIKARPGFYARPARSAVRRQSMELTRALAELRR